MEDLEASLLATSLVAAFLSIPAIFMQSSNSHALQLWGNALSVAIWLFFVIEATVLLRIAPTIGSGFDPTNSTMVVFV